MNKKNGAAWLGGWQFRVHALARPRVGGPPPLCCPPLPFFSAFGRSIRWVVCSHCHRAEDEEQAAADKRPDPDEALATHSPYRPRPEAGGRGGRLFCQVIFSQSQVPCKHFAFIRRFFFFFL